MKIKPKQVILVLGVIALLFVIIFNKNQFIQFWKLLFTIKFYVLAVVLLVQLFSYYLNALYYQSILKKFKYNIRVLRLFEGALAANFVNAIFPTVGIGGAAFLSQVLKPEVPRGEGFFVQIVRYVLSSIATAILIPVAIVLLLLGHHGSSGVFYFVIVSSTVIICFGVLLFFLVRREHIIRKLIHWLEKKFTFLNALNAKEFTGDFYRGFHVVFDDIRVMLIPFLWSAAYIFVEVLTLYIAFLAFGKVVNPGVVLMGYILANIASFFGGVIISIGAFELSLTGTLVALGQPFTLALSVTIVYRVVNMIIGLPPGFIYYRKYLE